MGKNTTLRDDNRPEELVELFVVSDGELKVSRHDTRLLVVSGSVTGQLEDFSGKVLKDGSEVDGSTGTDSLGIVALLQKTVDTTDGELKTGLGRSGRGLGLGRSPAFILGLPNLYVHGPLSQIL